MKPRSSWLPQWRADPDGRRLVWRAFQLLISLSLLLWLVSRVDTRTIAAITSLPPAILGISLAVFATSQIFGALRLWVLLRSQEAHFPPLYLMRLTFIGYFANNFLPSTVGGDVYKVVALTREGHELKVTILTLVADRVLSLIVTVVMTAAALPFTAFWSARPRIGGLFSSESLAIFAAALVVVLLIGGLLAGRIKFLGPAVAGLSERMALVVKRTLRFVRIPSAFTLAILFSCLSAAASILSQYIIADSLGMAIDVFQLTAVIGLVTLAALMPVSINGIGLQEAGLVALFQLLGVAQDPAIAFAIFSRALILGTSLVGGVLLLLSGQPLRGRHG